MIEPKYLSNLNTSKFMTNENLMELNSNKNINQEHLGKKSNYQLDDSKCLANSISLNKIKNNILNQVQNNNQEEEIKVNEDYNSKNPNIMHINSKIEFQSKDKINEPKKLIYHKKTLNTLCKINKKSKSKDKIKGINNINAKNDKEENASIKNNDLNSNISDYFNDISKLLKIKEKNKIMNFNELTLIEYLNEQIKNMKYNKNNINKGNNETNIKDKDKDKEMRDNKDIYKNNNNSEETKVNTLDMNNMIINNTPKSYRENNNKIKNNKLNSHFFLKNSQRYITYKNFLNSSNSNSNSNYNYNFSFSNNKKSNKIEMKKLSKNKIKIDKSNFLKKSLSKPKLSKKISLISLDNKYLEHNLSFSKQHIKTNNSYRINRTKRNCIPKNLLKISFNKNNSNCLNNSSNLYLKNRNKKERITEYYNYSNRSIKNLNKKNKIYCLKKNKTSEKSFTNLKNGRADAKSLKTKKKIDLSRSNSNKEINKENSNDKPLFYVQIDLSKLMNETSAKKEKTNKKYGFSKSNKNIGYKDININDFKNDFIIIPKKYDNK